MQQDTDHYDWDIDQFIVLALMVCCNGDRVKLITLFMFTTSLSLFSASCQGFVRLNSELVNFYHCLRFNVI